MWPSSEDSPSVLREQSWLGLELECRLSPDGATEEDGVLQND